MHKTKQTLRDEFRQQRQMLTLKARQEAATKLKHNIQKIWPKNATRSAVYFSHDHEISLKPTIKWLWQNNIMVYLPVVHPILARQLWFHHYQKQTPLQKNRYGINEPTIDPRQIIAPFELDIVFVPLVAFGQQGQRLGMGGGYYDSSFCFIANDQENSKRPLLIGCAYQFQTSNSITQEAHDLVMDAIVTD